MPSIRCRNPRVRVIKREDFPIRKTSFTHHCGSVLTHADAVSRAVAVEDEVIAGTTNFIEIAPNLVPSESPANRQTKTLGIDCLDLRTAEAKSLNPARIRPAKDFNRGHTIHA